MGGSCPTAAEYAQSFSKRRSPSRHASGSAHCAWLVTLDAGLAHLFLPTNRKTREAPSFSTVSLGQASAGTVGSKLLYGAK